MRGKIENPDLALNYVLGGKAKFTLVSPKTSARFTYKVNKAENGNLYFVSLLTSPDNENGFSYIGVITSKKEFKQTAKSRVSNTAPGYVAFEFTLKKLVEHKLPVELWHEGKCGCCGRTLTVPESIETGIGPICANKGH